MEVYTPSTIVVVEELLWFPLRTFQQMFLEIFEWEEPFSNHSLPRLLQLETTGVQPLPYVKVLES